MRIALVTETWHPSVNGVVTRLTATVRELRRRGHELLLVTPAAAEPACAPPGVAVATVPSVGLPFIYGGQPWGLPLPRAVQAIRRFQPDVVHAVSPFLLGWAGLVYARNDRVPLVCSYHTHIARYAHFYRAGFAERPVWAIVRLAHRQAQVNLAASPAARDELEAEGVPDVRVWPGGVEMGGFHPALATPEMRRRLTGGSPERRLCLYVGRLAAEKGIGRLLPVADPASDRHLALVGDGPARGELEQLFAGRPVTFTGTLSGGALAQAYASADIFVFPSTTDTLGLVLLEAMASGLPVVAARTPAAHELLARTPAASLFEADAPASLVAGVERWLHTELDRTEVAGAARRHLADWRHATDVLLATYTAAIHRAGRSLAA